MGKRKNNYDGIARRRNLKYLKALEELGGQVNKADEICDYLDESSSGNVHDGLMKLEEGGYIKRGEGTGERNLTTKTAEITEKGQKTLDLIAEDEARDI